MMRMMLGKETMMIGMTRRSLNQALLAAAATLAVPAQASAQQLKSLKITAPAGPGGGYDQLARTLQEVLMAEKLVASVQVINVPGAGGTVGLAGFANSRASISRCSSPRARPSRPSRTSSPSSPRTRVR